MMLDDSTPHDEVSTGELSEALGITPATIRRYLEQKDPRLCRGLLKTPGGQARWKLADAACIVEAFGRPLPAHWQKKEQP